MELKCHIRVHYSSVPVSVLSRLQTTPSNVNFKIRTVSYYPPSCPCFPNKTAYTFLASPNRVTFQLCVILSAPQVMKRLPNVNSIQSLVIPRCQESFLPPHPTPHPHPVSWIPIRWLCSTTTKHPIQVQKFWNIGHLLYEMQKWIYHWKYCKRSTGSPVLRKLRLNPNTEQKFRRTHV
jgi:hypothetical protein